MKNYFINLVSLTILLSMQTNSSPKQAATYVADHGSFYIAVVGEGIGGFQVDPSTPHLFPLDRSQSVAMLEGAIEALEKSPRLEPKRSYLKIRKFDDKARVRDAEIIARMIQYDPDIIAVIGHGTSETTKAASQFYAETHIPFIMPIATSPDVFYPPGRQFKERTRFRNCFRLPPSDQLAQIPAVAYVAKNIVKSTKCLLIGDSSTGAIGYSKTLFNPLVRLLDPILVSNLQVDREAEDFEKLSDNVVLDPPDLIVFCGYGSTAIKLLNALRSTYQGIAPETRPSIILTDGCYIPEINLSGFHVYLTFPAPPLEGIPTDNIDSNLIRELLIRNKQKQTYHIYGYDAVLLISQAIDEAKKEGRITRDRIIEMLAKTTSLPGAFLPYMFQNGENMLLRYYVYESPGMGQKSNCDFVFKEIVPQETLIPYSTPGKVQ